jgi:hypothetical protein
MKSVLAALAILTLAGCAGDLEQRSPTNPTPPVIPAVYDSVWGKVIDESGVCIVDAKVEVVSGQRVGQEITQGTPCSVWSYGFPEDGEGFGFTGLTPDGQMTLRASAKGYTSKDVTVSPQTARGQFVIIGLTRTQ